MGERDEHRADGDPPRPPGHFMEEQYADDTARFLAEVKRLAERRRHDAPRELWHPPNRRPS